MCITTETFPAVSFVTNNDGSKYILWYTPLFPHTDTSRTSSVSTTTINITGCNYKTYKALNSIHNTLEYIQTPTLTAVSPKFIPRFIEYDPDQTINDANKLMVSGTDFDSTVTYYFMFIMDWAL